MNRQQEFRRAVERMKRADVLRKRDALVPRQENQEMVVVWAALLSEARDKGYLEKMDKPKRKG